MHFRIFVALQIRLVVALSGTSIQNSDKKKKKTISLSGGKEMAREQNNPILKLSILVTCSYICGTVTQVHAEYDLFIKLFEVNFCKTIKHSLTKFALCSKFFLLVVAFFWLLMSMRSFVDTKLILWFLFLNVITNATS